MVQVGARATPFTPATRLRETARIFTPTSSPCQELLEYLRDLPLERPFPLSGTMGESTVTIVGQNFMPKANGGLLILVKAINMQPFQPTISATIQQIVLNSAMAAILWLSQAHLQARSIFSLTLFWKWAANR